MRAHLTALLWVIYFTISLRTNAALDSNFLLPDTAVPPGTLRIIALGTGTPTVSISQAATSYLMQLGGQRNILFDVGTGSIAHLYATQVDLATIDTVFLSHLHSDHVTDLGPLYALAKGRSRPLTVYGPSGDIPEAGTAAMVAGLRQFLFWDQHARNHVKSFPPNYQGNRLLAREFDHRAEKQLIFQEDGIAVYSNVAFHYDTPGPVSLRLEWNNLSVTYSGDTIPLDTFVDFAQGSDVIIHESVGPVVNLENEPRWIQDTLSNHTFQAEAGAIFSVLQPRLAIATHLKVTPYTVTPIISAIRSMYQGPLAVAADFDVWDLSSSSIVQRRFVPLAEKSGYEFDEHPQTYCLTNGNVASASRPSVVAGNLTVFTLPQTSSSCEAEACLTAC